MEPNPVASSTQGTPPEPTASRPGSTADFNELLAKHASTVGNWASLVDEEAPVGESEGPAGVWMGASQRASAPLGQPLNNNQYTGQGPPRQFSRPGAFPQQHQGSREQQQGSFRGPPNQYDSRGVGRQQPQYGQYQRDGGQRQRQQPQQQSRVKTFAPRQETNDVRASQNRGKFGPPPVRPPSQISPPSASSEHPKEQFKQPSTVPAPAPVPVPPAKPRVNPFGAAKAVDTSKPFAETEAKLLAERQQVKERSAAHSHAASGATTPSATEPSVPFSKHAAEVETKFLPERHVNEKEAKDRASVPSHAASGTASPSSTEPVSATCTPPVPGSVRLMKREDRVSDNSGVYAQQAKPPVQQQQRPYMGHYADMQSSSGAMPGQQMPQHPQSSPYMQRPHGQHPMQQQQQAHMGHYPEMQSSSGSMSGHQMPQHMQGSPHMQRPLGQPQMQQQQHMHMGHYPDMQSASGAMPGQQMPQHMQGSPHMQRPPGQPPGWPPNYPNAAYAPSFVVPVWSPQQQQQQQQHQQVANLMAMQVHKEVLECERQLQLLYTQPPRPEIAHQIAYVQTHLNNLRLRLHPSNQAQAVMGPPPGMIRPPEQHLRMAPPQYVVPTVSPQAGAHMQPPPQMPIQRIPPPGMHQMSAEQQQFAVAFMQPGANQVQLSIPPDMVGKIGINVYHQQQYSSQNTGGSGSSIAGMPMPVETPSLTARDSVPPEPYPSNRSHEKPPAIPQTFGKPPNFEANKVPPTAAEPAYTSAPTPKESQGADRTREFTATPSATPPPSQAVPLSSAPPSSAPTEFTPKEEPQTAVEASDDTKDKRAPSAEAKPSTEESTIAAKQEEDITVAPKHFPDNRERYSGQGSRGKYPRQSTYPQPQQQQGSFRRAPPPPNNMRGAGRRQSAPFQQQQREGPQHPKPQPQQLYNKKPYIPRPNPNTTQGQKERSEHSAPTRPSPQRTPVSPSTAPLDEVKPQRTSPPQSTSPPSQSKPHPYGAAKAVDTTKRTAEIEAKVRAEKEAKEKAAAQSHAASGATSPSTTEPPTLDNAPSVAGNIRLMKREDRVSEDSGVPRNESRHSLDGNLERVSNMSRRTNSSSSVAHDPHRQFTRPPQKYNGPAHTNTRDKKFVEKPHRIDSRRSTAERSDKSQTTRPPRPQQPPHPDGQRPRHGPPYGQKGGVRQGHGGPRSVEKTDSDTNAPVANKPTDDRRPSIPKTNETAAKAPTDVAKELEPTSSSNGKPEQSTHPVVEAKPSDHSIPPKKPLTFTNSSRKVSHSASTVIAPPTPVVDAVKQLPNGPAQAATSSVEQPAVPKADTASSKKAAKKEKKASGTKFAKAKESSITSKNKFGALLGCDVYD